MATLPPINDVQYDLIVELTRGQPGSPSNKALRSVMIDGSTVKEAAAKESVPDHNVNKGLRRMLEIHRKLLNAYPPHPSAGDA